MECVTDEEENRMWTKNQDEKRRATMIPADGAEVCQRGGGIHSMEGKKGTGSTVGGNKTELSEEKFKAWRARKDMEHP